MTPASRNHRRGMTLVELLVVVAIIGLLSVAVLPNLANSAGTRRVRETARAVSSFIAGAQSQAIGSRTGAGVWFDLLPNVIVDGAGVSHVVALDMALSEIPTPYSGEATNATVHVMPITPIMSDRAALSFLPTAGDFIPPVAPGTLNLFIRLGSSDSPFLLEFANGAWLARMDPARSQTPSNMFWPVTPAGQGVSYEVLLPPRKNPVRSLTVEPGIAIDLTWTFIGADPGTWPTPPGSLLNVAAPVQLLYGTTGKPSMAIANGAAGVTVLEPFYVLVTSIEAIQEGTSFTTSRSYWVAVDPSGGIPRIAEVNPLPVGNPLPLTRDALILTQKFIRDASLQTGG